MSGDEIWKKAFGIPAFHRIPLRTDAESYFEAKDDPACLKRGRPKGAAP